MSKTFNDAQTRAAVQDDRATPSIFDELKERYGITMTPNDAGEVLHQHPSHIRALCQAGELPAIRIGKRWHIVTAKLAAMLEGEAVVHDGE